MFVSIAFLALMIACALYDLLQLRIPNALTAGLVVLFAIHAFIRPLPFAALGGHVAVGVAIFAAAAILYRFGMIGGGDVKLLAAIGLWAGPNLFLAHLFLTSLAAVLLLLVILLTRRLYFAALASVPRLDAIPIPPVLQQGAGIPYGVAIVAAAMLLNIPSAP